MQAPHLRARYRHIMGFFARATASFIFWELGLRIVTRRTRSAHYKQIAAGHKSAN